MPLAKELALEYARYKASQNIEHYILNDLKDRDRYEVKNILERWLLNLYNNSNINRLESTIESDEKFISEFKEKHIPKDPEASLIQIKNFINDINKSLLYVDVNISNNMLIYDKASFLITPRVSYLIDISNPVTVMKMLLRYESLFMGGNQWGIPFGVADILYEIGFRVEGFASPLNSRFIGKKNCYFNSLFFDTDSPFGSLGNFFTANFDRIEGFFMINPPYLPSFFESEYLINRINALLGKGKVIHFLMAAWKDSRIYQNLSNSKYLTDTINLKKNEHFYQTANREKIKAAFDSTVFILGKKFPDHIINEMIKSWKI